MKKAIFIVAVAVSIFLPARSLFAQDVALTQIVRGEDMEKSFPRFDSVTSEQFGLNTYSRGPNFNDRIGCIVNFCPELVSISNFSFGNFSNNGSRYRYIWTAKAKVIAFSVSTIEFDPFGNELAGTSQTLPNASSSKIMPDDPSAGIGRRGGLSLHRIESIQPNVECLSTLPGLGTSATLFEHQTVSEAILKHLPPHLRDFFPEQKHPESLNNVEVMGEERGPGQELTGRSTRFTVITFVSHVRYVDASGKTKFWDFRPEAYSGGLLDGLSLVSANHLENHGTDLFIFSKLIAVGEVVAANEYLEKVMKKWTSGTPPKVKP